MYPVDFLPAVRTPVRGRGAFTLVELLVCMAIVAVLIGIFIPVYSRVTQSARAAACVSNLRQIGAALQLYLNDHERIMPTLQAGRTDKNVNVPVIDNTLNAYTQNQGVFACPADSGGVAAASGTSYYWNVALNGQVTANLNFFRNFNQSQIPILSDKGAYHPYTDTKVNLLYADGHADKDLILSVNPSQ